MKLCKVKNPNRAKRCDNVAEVMKNILKFAHQLDYGRKQYPDICLRGAPRPV